MVLCLIGCHRGSDDDTPDSGREDSWWEDLPAGLDFRVEGRGHDGWYQFGLGGGTTSSCRHFADADYLQIYGSSARGDNLALYVLQASIGTERIEAIDYTTFNSPYSAYPPSWTGAWRNVDFERDDPYVRPLTPSEQAECWMDVHFHAPYDELAARFECPWLREAPNEEDQGTISLVGTILCTVELE